MQKVLVTGGAGFIGSHTVDRLLAAGSSVIVLDNFVTGSRDNLPKDHPNLKIIEGDVLNAPLLNQLIQEVDAVLHLAALPSVTESISNPIHSLQTNLQSLVQVLQAIREKKSVTRLVYASSAAVYGEDSPLPCCDETLITARALSPYALEKANNERYAELFLNLFGIQSLGLRYFNVYGKRQNPSSIYSGVITAFMDRYKNKKSVTIYGDGTQSRDFIHVEDVARANCMALSSDYCGVLNVATGTPETLLSLTRYIEAAGGEPINIEFEKRRPGDILQSYAKTEKANRHLAFKAEMQLAEGIKSL